MAALTANRKRRVRNLGAQQKGAILAVSSITLFEGAVLCYSAAASTVTNAADTASFRLAGIYAGAAQTVGASNTTVKLEFEFGHEEWIPQDGNLAAGAEGKNAIVLDNGTLTNAATATNDVPVGKIVELETINGTAGAWVQVGVFAATNA